MCIYTSLFLCELCYFCCLSCIPKSYASPSAFQKAVIIGMCHHIWIRNADKDIKQTENSSNIFVK